MISGLTVCKRQYLGRNAAKCCHCLPKSIESQVHVARRTLLCVGTVGIALPVLGNITFAAQNDLASPPQTAARLPIEEVKDRLIVCFVEGQYYVSGALDFGIFADDCLFTDPTVRVQGKLFHHLFPKHLRLSMAWIINK